MSQTIICDDPGHNIIYTKEWMPLDNEGIRDIIYSELRQKKLIRQAHCYVALQKERNNRSLISYRTF